jgi:methionine synthase II (cobalamin-independent)
VDEAKSQLSIALAKQAMLAVQYAAKAAYAVDKVLATLAIMMKMDLHICYSIANHFRQRFH